MSDPGFSRVPHAAALYLGVVQLLFVTCWTIYVVFLPGLLESAGIPARYAIWILMLDQLVFMVMDTLMGIAADRSARTLGRVGPLILTGTIVSCVAFMLVPHVALLGTAPALSLALILIWAATSSALRAPPFVMFSKYAAVPALPWMNALVLTGLAIGGALAPYLGVTLRNLDPRLPFAVSSAALLAATAGLIWVERRLAGQPVAVAPAPARAALPRGAWLFVLAYLMLALGFQFHFSLNSAGQYLRFAPPERLDYLMPVFWIGFNLAMFPGAALAKRHGTLRVVAAAAALGAGGAFAAAQAPTLEVLLGAQLVAGGAWGCVLMAGFAAAVEFGRSGREGWALGLLFAALAAATLTRMGTAAAGFHQSHEFAAALVLAPVLLWCAATVLLAWLALKAPLQAPV